MTCRTALVLGGSKGIGRACALKLALAGHRTVVVSRSKANLTPVEKELRKINKENIVFPGDIRDADFLATLFYELQDRFGGVDILVNNGQGPEPGSLMSLEDSAWVNTFQDIAMPVIRATKFALTQMKASNWGRVITIASVSAKQPLDNMDLSNFYRAGIANLMKSLAYQVAVQNVTVHVICPGFVDTERSQERRAQRARELGISIAKTLRTSESSVPIGRLASAEEIGSVCEFLASEKSSYMTGNVMQVDGGYSRAF
jgi:3-oxoacyl-[acyl-carrier protein] reductase